MTFLFSLALLLASVIYPNAQSESWIDGPEAYFVTDEERGEWAGLATREERDAFKERYWLRRDPTPGTAANEFRDTILGRIKYADSAFGIEETPGSRTARGFLFIVFGSPARASQDYLSTPSPGQRGMIGMNEGTETIFRWTWDRERTPDLMAALARPKLEISVILEPNRRRDRIENPGLAMEFRDLLAGKSIVNPDLVAPADAAPAPIAESVPLLASSTEDAWRAAASGGASSPARAAGSAVVFTPEGSPRAVVWAFDEAAAAPSVALRLTKEGEETARVWSGTAAGTRQLLASRPGSVWVASLELPEGIWRGDVATSRTASAPLQLAIPPAGELGVSSLLVGGGPEGGSASDPLFAIGPLSFRPRADAQFSPSESLWYFLQFRGALPEGTVMEPKLMKKGKGIVLGWQPFAPALVAAGPNLNVAGYEIPLATIEPGTYTLYVTLIAGEQKIVRRADFEVANR
ncbi:MAG TPA: GWxTD domain-containing protein [Thermoanaerobaculia bacterium]